MGTERENLGVESSALRSKHCTVIREVCTDVQGLYTAVHGEAGQFATSTRLLLLIGFVDAVLIGGK